MITYTGKLHQTIGDLCNQYRCIAEYGDFEWHPKGVTQDEAKTIAGRLDKMAERATHTRISDLDLAWLKTL